MAQPPLTDPSEYSQSSESVKTEPPLANLSKHPHPNQSPPPIFTRPPLIEYSPPGPPPRNFRPNQREKKILNQRRECRAHYHPMYIFPAQRLQCLRDWYQDDWYRSIIAARGSVAQHVADMYLDREMTNRQEAVFLELTERGEVEPIMLQGGYYDENDMWIEHSSKETVAEEESVYSRIVALYRERQIYIQEAGVRRLGVWSDWWAEKMKPRRLRNRRVVVACEATILFLPDDYYKRKVEFATEVYGMLEKAGDAARARMVVDDLGNLFPWSREDVCARLMYAVVSYEGLERELTACLRMEGAVSRTSSLGR
ncbi:hypothetical protein G6011_01996 [Alternaria panax]|uniref:Uncharacterized protein n=1 Tax=Alternaria panax TaxID=48097 RepID=A0AAD4FFN1_9PLEO|nr:hypothetical protein G6011_01996 [Alternaria panax]